MAYNENNPDKSVHVAFYTDMLMELTGKGMPPKAGEAPIKGQKDFITQRHNEGLDTVTNRSGDTHLWLGLPLVVLAPFFYPIVKVVNYFFSDKNLEHRRIAYDNDIGAVNRAEAVLTDAIGMLKSHRRVDYQNVYEVTKVAFEISKQITDELLAKDEFVRPMQGLPYSINGPAKKEEVWDATKRASFTTAHFQNNKESALNNNRVRLEAVALRMDAYKAGA